MLIVMHRRNTRAELEATPPQYGVEIDIRTRNSTLMLHHDPFADGELFEDWIEGYRHSLLILNTKEEGLETRLLSIMRDRGIEDFFFLDQSFPFLVRTARSGEARCAVRVSEYESVSTALALAGLVRWVWVDCFSRFPLDREDASRLAEAGLDLCLVSPELQGRTDPAEIASMRKLLSREGIVPAAVCTKRPDLWE